MFGISLFAGINNRREGVESVLLLVNYSSIRFHSLSILILGTR